MSDIDFQNGFVCGMATRGLTKSLVVSTGDLLNGFAVINGAKGVWPLVVRNGFWVSEQTGLAPIYASNVLMGVKYTRSIFANNMTSAYSLSIA